MPKTLDKQKSTGQFLITMHGATIAAHFKGRACRFVTPHNEERWAALAAELLHWVRFHGMLPKTLADTCLLFQAIVRQARSAKAESERNAKR